MDHQLQFDPKLIRRYDTAGPRYTSYPSAAEFHQDFGDVQYCRRAADSNRAAAPRPLSLYFHLPFCNTICYYCACNKIITKDHGRTAPYLTRLHREVAMQAELFDPERRVDQLHWGGGTPTFLSHNEMGALMDETRKYFALREDGQGEYSIEIDPRCADAGTVAMLAGLGFNRLSVGVQDFDPAVQQAVNRIQTEEETRAVLEAACSSGFRSINVDLIYGLPLQRVATFARTLDRVLDVDPDRISVFNYAHLPEIFKPQRRIQAAQLPRPEEKLAILAYTIERLTDAGYVYIGMDHFAKPDDELAVAQRWGTLYRNFQGYSTHADCDLIGMGVTAIGKLGNSYSQNLREMSDYLEAIDQNRLPILRGIELSSDDIQRQAIISRLVCHFELDIDAWQKEYDTDFFERFGPELAELRRMEQDGLLSVGAERITVHPVGKLLVRNICMVFDRYARERRSTRFSRVI